MNTLREQRVGASVLYCFRDTAGRWYLLEPHQQRGLEEVVADPDTAGVSFRDEALFVRRLGMIHGPTCIVHGNGVVVVYVEHGGGFVAEWVFLEYWEVGCDVRRESFTIPIELQAMVDWRERLNAIFNERLDKLLLAPAALVSLGPYPAEL